MDRPAPQWDRLPGAGTAEEYERLLVIERALDVVTIAHLDRLGVAAGWRCAEVGAGAGSIARWLAERAGAAHVVATDLYPEFLAPIAAFGVNVMRHDVTVDPPFGEGFDLVHTRLVLEHLPEREEVLERLAASLTPGGWLLIEDALVTPALASDPLLARSEEALMAILADTVGTDFTWARTLPLSLERAGLTDVVAEVSSQVVRGATHIATALLVTLRMIESTVVSRGQLTPDDLDRVARLLADPTFVDHSCVMVAAWGRRPAEG